VSAPSSRTSVTVQLSPLRTQPGRAQAAVVAAGDDGIPDRGAGAVVQLDLAAGVHGAVEDQIGPGPLVERWTDSFESVTSTLARPASVGRQAV
jgi:hypothetical protein